jgi:hypothetical protein
LILDQDQDQDLMLGVEGLAKTFAPIAIAIKQLKSPRVDHPLLFSPWHQHTQDRVRATLKT